MPPPDPVGRLDRTVPLLLLPVRIETRFDSRLLRRDLLVRIYPDHVHVDKHRPRLSAAEREAGEAFWRGAWPATVKRDVLDRRFARQAARFGAQRAAWIAEATRPTNWARRDERAAPGEPTFPVAPATGTRAPAPALARLLPERFTVFGYQRRELQFTAEGSRIRRNLPVAPELGASGQAPRSMPELLRAQGLDWLLSFEGAVAEGMALRIPLEGHVSREEPLDLFVLGLEHGRTPADAANSLSALLAAHQWQDGLDFVRRGTPTNNSDDRRSGLSTSSPDLGALLSTVLAGTDELPASDLAIAQKPFALSAARALGLEQGSILERVPLGNDRQLELGAAMNAALWPATWGHFLRGMLSGAVPDRWIDWTREHFIAHVRGGGTLPTLRLGKQPYGLLPVAAPLPRESSDTPGLVGLERLLEELSDAWKQAVETRVAHLDPDATDRPADAPPTSGALTDAVHALARTLGATPNPSDLVLRPVTHEIATYSDAMGLAVIILLPIALGPFPAIATPIMNAVTAATTLEQQIEPLERAVASGNPSVDDYDPRYPMGALYLEAHRSGSDAETRANAQNGIDFIEGVLLKILYNHRERAAPLLALGPDRREVTARMPDDSDPALLSSLFGEDPERQQWTAPLVARGRDAGAEIAAWLDALIAEAGDPERPAPPPVTPAPLLFQLLQRGLRVVHASDRRDFVAALRRLARAVRAGELSQPGVDLELLLLETLGTSMHRLDAWWSGSASQRLQELRRERPTGIQVGAFGWVTGLRPSSDASSQGFVHAPTLDHAVTAAVIRSGWSALGDGALGVNISSARMRAATAINDGIRDGRGLDDLLGQRLERRLHDARLDAFVERIRRAVLEGTGHGGREPNVVVDGHIVARAWLDGNEADPLGAEEGAVREQLSRVVNAAGGDTARLKAQLDAHAAELDGLADATLVQAVHSIVRGNPAGASAALGGVTGADAGPSSLNALQTSRAGQHVTHRVVALLDVAPPPSGSPAPTAVAEPALEAWLGRVLPAQSLVVYGAWLESAEGRRFVGPLSLADAELGWLELLEDLPTGADFDGSRLAARLSLPLQRAAAREGLTLTVHIDPAADGRAPDGQLTLRLLLPAALAVRGLLHGGRPADAADLSDVDEPSSADAGPIGERATALGSAARRAATSLRAALDRQAPSAELLDGLTELARWHVPGATTHAGLLDIAAGDAADHAVLRVEADAAWAQLDARLHAFDAIVGTDLVAQVGRVRALLPGARLLPPFTAPQPARLEASTARSTARLARGAGLAWLRQAGRVRERVRAAAAAIDLVDAAREAAGFEPLLLQLPDHAEEGWAATTRPAQDSGPRTCVLSVTGRPQSSARLVGLVIDAWTEVIPDRRVTSGVAIHFDAPSAQAPQAWLLALPPATGAWNQDAVLALIRQTLDRARQRAVGPEEIEGYGQFLPAIYLGDDADPGGRR